MKIKYPLSAIVLIYLSTFASEMFATRTAQPNVLFISIDDLNDWTGTQGGHQQAITPHMDRLASQSVQFDNAHCAQAVCTASRNSLLSGLHPTTTGWYGSTSAMRRSYDEVMGEHTMLPQYFKDNGYKTMAVGKIFHSGVSDYKERTSAFWDETGEEYKVPKELKARGEGYGGTKFYPFPREGSQIIDRYGPDFDDGNSLCWGALEREDMPDGKMFDELIAEWAVERLDEDHDKPFFLAVGFVRPHVPYTAPKEYFDWYSLDDIVMPEVPDDEMTDIPIMGKSIAYGTIKTGDHYAVVNLSDTYWREMVLAYLACVSFVDDQLGKVLLALENSQYADNTIVVLWSDHGQHMGEKKHWRKQSLWEESTQVPLFFGVPGMKANGKRSDRVVSLLDIYPTLLDLCGLPPVEKLEGQSLVPLLKNPKRKWDKPVLNSWYYGNRAVRSERYRYIQYRDGSEEFYDHAGDPGEFTNLAENPEYVDIIAKHRAWLPKEDALPAGTTEWKPDRLDRRVGNWLEKESIPEWLK